MATTVSLKSLLDAAVHFGHQTRRWNPKMKPYIFTDRNGIYIIDLRRTLVELDRAYTFVSALVARGGKLLFVGTKKQAQEPIQRAAERCGMPYVNNRWLGGMLTNFVTIRSRVSRMEELEAMEDDGRMATLPKKEQIYLRKQLEKLQINLNGVRAMYEVPQAIFVVDSKREELAICEAQRLGVPVIGIIDTNSDPDEVDFGIPGNDDAISSVTLISDAIADAALEGGAGAVFSESEMTLSAAEKTGSPAVVTGSAIAFETPIAPEPLAAAEPLTATEPPVAAEPLVTEPLVTAAATAPFVSAEAPAAPEAASAPESLTTIAEPPVTASPLAASAIAEPFTPTVSEPLSPGTAAAEPLATTETQN
jgi:small subunit ribosomal protein S2